LLENRPLHAGAIFSLMAVKRKNLYRKKIQHKPSDEKKISVASLNYLKMSLKGIFFLLFSMTLKGILRFFLRKIFS
jgi:hypothetical protein